MAHGFPQIKAQIYADNSTIDFFSYSPTVLQSYSPTVLQSYSLPVLPSVRNKPKDFYFKHCQHLVKPVFSYIYR